jgi:hypothetical protein
MKNELDNINKIMAIQKEIHNFDMAKTIGQCDHCACSLDLSENLKKIING